MFSLLITLLLVVAVVAGVLILNRLRGDEQILDRIQQQLTQLNMNQAELAAALTLANQQITKIRQEQEENSTAQRAAIATLTAKVDELTALLAAGTVTEDVANALTAVKSSLQAFDDTIPDAPAPPAQG